MSNIPSTVHYIWLGDKPISDFDKACMESVKELHPAWEFKLHTDNSVFEAPELSKVKDALYRVWNDCHKCNWNHSPLALQSDLLRLCLVYVYGGVYLDLDFFALKDLDPFLEEEVILAYVDSSRLVGEAVLGMRAKDRRLYDLIEQHSTNEPYPILEENKLSWNLNTNMSAWATYFSFEPFAPAYFIPHTRTADPSTIYKATNDTTLVHCWRQHTYDLDKLRALRGKSFRPEWWGEEDNTPVQVAEGGRPVGCYRSKG